MATVIKLTEPYYKEFHDRLGVYFNETQATDVYMGTVALQANWPNTPPPEVGYKHKLAYVKFNWPNCAFRICFGFRTCEGNQEIVALTCRTKQELQKGNKNANQEWYRHMATVGIDRWDSYRRDLIASWIIY